MVNSDVILTLDVQVDGVAGAVTLLVAGNARVLPRPRPRHVLQNQALVAHHDAVCRPVLHDFSLNNKPNHKKLQILQIFVYEINLRLAAGVEICEFGWRLLLAKRLNFNFLINGVQVIYSVNYLTKEFFISFLIRDKAKINISLKPVFKEIKAVKILMLTKFQLQAGFWPTFQQNRQLFFSQYPG